MENQNYDYGRLDYNQLIFMQINRIESTTAEKFDNARQRLTSLRWQIEGLRNLLTEEMLTKEFYEKEKAIKQELNALFSFDNIREPNKEITYFNVLNRYFRLCLKIIAHTGNLYKVKATGIA